MSHLQDLMNRAARVTDPDLRRLEEIRRLDEDIAACSDFLEKKAQLEADVFCWQTEQGNLETALSKARAHAPDFAQVSEAVHRVAKAAKDLNDLIVYSSHIKGIYDFFLNVKFALWATGRLIPQSDDTLDSYSLSRFAKDEKLAGLDALLDSNRAGLAALRKSIEDLRHPSGQNSELAQRILFRDVVVGQRTERRIGYPIIFLTEKVQVPVVEKQPLNSQEREQVIAKALQDIDNLEKFIPVITHAMQPLGALATAWDKLRDAEYRARVASSELARVSDTQVAATQAALEDLRKRRQHPEFTL